MLARSAGVAFIVATATLLAGLAASAAVLDNFAGTQASAWVKGKYHRFRLIAAPIGVSGEKTLVYAGIHVVLEGNWKTYWRTPGEAGGIPPSFDFSQSKNLQSARVLYPVPKRLPGPYGETIGYKHEVVFPIHITPRDPDKPVDLVLSAYFGVCLDICIPAEGRAELRTGPRSVASGPLAPLIERYLIRVPGYGARDARVERMVAKLDGAGPHLTVDARFEGDGASADIFLEAPDGIYVPSPVRTPLDKAGRFRFRVDLTKSEDPALFKGRTLRLTLASERGQAEAKWRID